jgi:Flp pilus assembly protein TadG
MNEKMRCGVLCGRRGQAVVEFALILPLFLLLVFGALEFGRAYYDLHLLITAAREGGREASLPGTTEADVQATVDSFLTGAGLAGSWTAVPLAYDQSGTEIPLASAQEGDTVRVTVTYDFTVLVGSLLPGFTNTVQLRGRCAFRHE